MLGGKIYMDYTLTSDEIFAIEKFQGSSFKIIDALMKEGIESELRTNSKENGFPFLTREVLEQTLDDIRNLFSAITKSYMKKGGLKSSKALFKILPKSIVSSLNNRVVSFVTANSELGSNVLPKTNDTAFLLIDGNVPWVSLSSLDDGAEEIMFAPGKMRITEAILTTTAKYGKEYVASLDDIDIPAMDEKQVVDLKDKILEATEKMSEYLKYILATVDKPNFNNNPQAMSVIKEYSEWKKALVIYNLEQYRQVKAKVMEAPPLVNIDRNKKDKEQDVLEDTVSISDILAKLNPEDLRNLDLDAILDDNGNSDKTVEPDVIDNHQGLI